MHVSTHAHMCARTDLFTRLLKGQRVKVTENASERRNAHLNVSSILISLIISFQLQWTLKTWFSQFRSFGFNFIHPSVLPLSSHLFSFHSVSPFSPSPSQFWNISPQLLPLSSSSLSGVSVHQGDLLSRSDSPYLYNEPCAASHTNTCGTGIIIIV